MCCIGVLLQGGCPGCVQAVLGVCIPHQGIHGWHQQRGHPGNPSSKLPFQEGEECHRIALWTLILTIQHIALRMLLAYSAAGNSKPTVPAPAMRRLLETVWGDLVVGLSLIQTAPACRMPPMASRSHPGSGRAMGAGETGMQGFAVLRAVRPSHSMFGACRGGRTPLAKTGCQRRMHTPWRLQARACATEAPTPPSTMCPMTSMMVRTPLAELGSCSAQSRLHAVQMHALIEPTVHTYVWVDLPL